MGDLPCKLFDGPKLKKGYGREYDPIRKRTTVAHRLVYERHHGVILSPSEYVLHSCDNPPCIEPTHLFLGSHLDNMKDMTSKGRQATGEDHGMVTARDADVALCRSLYTGARGEQTLLAKRFGVTQPTIHNWVKDKYR